MTTANVNPHTKNKAYKFRSFVINTSFSKHLQKKITEFFCKSQSGFEMAIVSLSDIAMCISFFTFIMLLSRLNKDLLNDQCHRPEFDVIRR